MQLSLSELSLAELAARTQANVSTLAAQRRVELSFESADGRLTCDSDRIIQAMSNLATFMVKQSPDGANVKKQLRLQDNNLLVKIANNAEPIEQAKDLFDRFKVFHRTGSLSLPIAKQIIENHGGILELQSSETGNVFQINFPLIQAACALAASRQYHKYLQAICRQW